MMVIISMDGRMDGLVQVQIVNIQRLSSSLKLTARALASSSSCTWEAGGLHNRIRMAWARTFWNYRYRRAVVVFFYVMWLVCTQWIFTLMGNNRTSSSSVSIRGGSSIGHWFLRAEIKIYIEVRACHSNDDNWVQSWGVIAINIALPACPLNGIPQPKTDLECQWE